EAVRAGGTRGAPACAGQAPGRNRHATHAPAGRRDRPCGAGGLRREPAHRPHATRMGGARDARVAPRAHRFAGRPRARGTRLPVRRREQRRRGPRVELAPQARTRRDRDGARPRLPHRYGMKPRPSIRARLSKALLVWAVAWGAAVAAAIALTVPHEVDELLDDTLQSSAEVLAILLSPAHEASHAGRSDLADAPPRVLDDALLPEDRFAWQVVNAGGLVVLRSSLAPDTPLHPGATPGFSDLPDWRVYGTALPGDGGMLYVAQTLAE